MNTVFLRRLRVSDDFLVRNLFDKSDPEKWCCPAAHLQSRVERREILHRRHNREKPDQVKAGAGPECTQFSERRTATHNRFAIHVGTRMTAETSRVIGISVKDRP